MTIAELRQRAQRRTSNTYDTLFTRRVSIYITAVLYPLGVTANAVSAVNNLVAVAACALIAFGQARWHILAGIGLVHLYAVLDSVDGELARLRRVFTIKGLFLEDLSAFTMINGFWLAIGWFLHRATGDTWPVWLAVVVVAFGRNAMGAARRAINKWFESHRAVPAAADRGAGGDSALGGVRKLVEEHLLHYTNIWIALTTLTAIALYRPVTMLPVVGYVFAFYISAVLAKELAAIAVLARTGELARQASELANHASACVKAGTE
jgi:phosphatidylglycerophosphate synthase